MNVQNTYEQRFSVAPMLDWTTRHCRAFHRQLSKHATLYTEMVSAQTILFSKADPLYFRPEVEGEVILQLGGSDPEQFAQVAKKIQQNPDLYPYAGINLNVGCPSPRVTSGSFGACLMADPDLVADCMVALRDNCDLPLSIKCRIGIDDHENFEFLEDFVLANEEVGVTDFIIHARKAILHGLSPKQNREIPPLNYQRVYDLKAEYPELNISINGGIDNLKLAREQLEIVDGVMMGREAYNNPTILLGVDALLFNDYDNDFSRYHKIFDETLMSDQLYTLDPTQVKSVPHHFVDSTSGLYGSISDAFLAKRLVDPLIASADNLQREIFKHSRQRFEEHLAQGRRFAVEQEQLVVPIGRHQPKGEITTSARFQRLQNLANGQAMFNALDRLHDYWLEEANNGVAISHLFKPILGAFNGLPGARVFRRYLSENGFDPNSKIDELFYAIDLMYEKFILYTESSQ